MDVLQGVTDRPELLGVFVGYVDVELLLELHHELDDIEAVGTKVLNEAGIVGELLALDPQLLLDDCLHLLGMVGH